MTLDAPPKKIPQYRVLAEQLISGIMSGKYPVNSILPSENEFAVMHGVSRHTSREAMKVLERQGWITRRRRAGSMVVTDRPPANYDQKVQSVNDLLQYGSASRLHIVRSQEIIMDDVVAGLLHQKPGNSCVKMDAIRYQRHDNRPFAFSEIYFHVPTKAMRQRLCDLSQAIRYVKTRLDVRKIQIVEQTLTAENVDQDLAVTLDVQPGAATLKSLRAFVDSHGKRIAAAYTWHVGDLFSYTTVLTKN